MLTGLAGAIRGAEAVVHAHLCGGEDACWCGVYTTFFVLWEVLNHELSRCW